MTAVLKHHLEQSAKREGQNFRDFLLYFKDDGFYVDDCLASVTTDVAATQFKEVRRATLGEVHKEWQKWHSN